MGDFKDNNCFLRSVTMNDADLILEWVNDPADRVNSFSGEVIGRQEHYQWMKSCLGDPNIRLFILMLDDIEVGHIKVYADRKCAEIGYCIAPVWRGKGLSKKAIMLVSEEVKRDFPNVSTLVAQVKPTNIASIKALEANGYCEVMREYRFSLSDSE